MPSAQRPEKSLSLLPLAVVLLLVQACASVQRSPVPAELSEYASVNIIPNARHWGDVASQVYFKWIHADDAQIKANFPAIYAREHNYLALSGGGPKGAFGAGLLAGWAARGDLPRFVMVSGVSTGALIAPYAFLGSHYDQLIKEVYTEHGTDDLARRRNIFAILSGDAVSDVSGFSAMIEHYLTDAMIDEIGEQTRIGRDLLIGTTNLDTGRPVIWNIGVIALSDDPGRYELVRKVIRASASLPVAFPPVLIPVQVDGESYDELHVDGGVANQVFVYPLGMDWATVTEKLKVAGRPRLYVIRNAQINPPRKPVPARIIPIATSSLSSIMRTQGLGDLYRIYIGARRDKLDFNLAYIPDEFVDNSEEPFDANTMKELYQLGYELGVEGYRWRKVPPGVELESSPQNLAEMGPEKSATLQ